MKAFCDFICFVFVDLHTVKVSSGTFLGGTGRLLMNIYPLLPELNKVQTIPEVSINLQL